MKKKIIIGIVTVIATVAIVFGVLFLSGILVMVSFDSNGSRFVFPSIVLKGGTIKLPNIEKEGKSLDGWYLDNKKVANTTTYDKNVTLKAKWTTKTFTVSFNSNGGSKVKSIKVKCGSELKLPSNPKRSGYTFVSWVDKNGNPIYNKALLACENIKLKATWKKNSSKNNNTNKNNNNNTNNTSNNEVETNKTYTCPNGYTLNSNKKCEIKVSATKSCKTGFTYSTKKGFCYKEVNDALVYNCKSMTITGKNYTGTLVRDGDNYYCAYGEIERHNGSKRSCEHENYIYASNNKCYTRYVKGNYTTSCRSGRYFAEAKTLNDSQKVRACVDTESVIYSCDSGYTLEGSYCYKRIEPTVK